MIKSLFVLFCLLFPAACDQSDAIAQRLLTLDWEKATVGQIDKLVKAGADVNRRDKDGTTPLMLAVQKEINADVIEALIKNGADVNARDNYGWTPLMLAAQQNRNPEITKLLLDAGADANIHNLVGWTPAFVAKLDNKNPDVYALLNDKEEKTSAFEEEVSFLENIDWKKISVRELDKLIKAGADVYSSDEYGFTPLMVAVQEKAEPVVIKELIKLGADVNARNKDGWTPLMIMAGGHMNAAIIKKINEIDENLKKTKQKKKKRKKKKKNEDDFPAFQDDKTPSAEKRRYSEIVNILIKAGADVNDRDYAGMTPLTIAAISRNDSGIIEALLQAGANVNVRDNASKTVFDYVETDPVFNKKPVYWKIVNSRYKKALNWKKATVEKVKAAISDGTDVNGRDKNGMTPLMNAVQNKNPAVAKLLIDAGADVNACDNDNGTSLMYVTAFNANLKTADFLIKAGAKVNVRNKFDETPLIIAIKNRASPKLIELLIKAGATE